MDTIDSIQQPVLLSGGKDLPNTILGWQLSNENRRLGSIRHAV